jgi:hypothetical protein
MNHGLYHESPGCHIVAAIVVSWVLSSLRQDSAQLFQSEERTVLLASAGPSAPPVEGSQLQWMDGIVNILNGGQDRQNGLNSARSLSETKSRPVTTSTDLRIFVTEKQTSLTLREGSHFPEV